jgi:hypothetical protein
MSRNLTKTALFKVRSFLEHPKHERLSQASAFKPRERIMFLIWLIGSKQIGLLYVAVFKKIEFSLELMKTTSAFLRLCSEQK